MTAVLTSALETRLVRPPDDAATIHRWVDDERAHFWGMRGCSVQDVVDAYEAIAALPHHDAFLGTYEGEPQFLVERYDPAHDRLAEYYPVKPGDVGMHFLVAPPQRPIPGFTLAVIRHAMDLVLADPAAQRVIVEPDLRNTAVHRLNAAVGFVPITIIRLPEKDAYLSFCTRAQYEESRAGGDR